MENIKKYLENWLSEIENYSFAKYEELPDLDLYMDQVITYLERVFNVLKTSSTDKQITSSMVNNYVKGKVIAPPISKKYNREHLAMLEELNTLKKVLSIDEIKEILSLSGESNLDSFNEFKELHSEKLSSAVNVTREKLNNTDSSNQALAKVALDLSLNAYSYLTIAKRILFYIKLDEANKENKRNKKEKDKEKDKELKPEDLLK